MEDDNKDSNDGNLEFDANDCKNDLVACGCSACGGVFRMSRRIPMMQGNDERGFGVCASRELKDITPTTFHTKRQRDDDVMNLFTKKNMKPVTISISWDLHADNVDICPDCAYDILIAQMKEEQARYKIYKQEGELMSKAILSTSIEDIE